MIHTRDAWDDTFAILAAEGVPETTVFHCFTGGADEARRALAMGAYLSFSGIVSFKSADDVRAAAAACPDDRLLVETDSAALIMRRASINSVFVQMAKPRRKPGRPNFFEKLSM